MDIKKMCLTAIVLMMFYLFNPLYTTDVLASEEEVVIDQSMDEAEDNNNSESTEDEDDQNLEQTEEIIARKDEDLEGEELSEAGKEEDSEGEELSDASKEEDSEGEELSDASKDDDSKDEEKEDKPIKTHAIREEERIDNAQVIEGDHQINIQSTQETETIAASQEIKEATFVPLSNGVHRDEVIDLKLDLEKLGFHVSDNPTTYFGPQTESVVKAFQTYYGLKEDEPGVAGIETLTKIEELLASPFQDGSSHEDTIQLKIDLERLGFKVSNSPTDYYGSTTEEKVKAFQRKYALVDNGIADDRTRDKIAELLQAPLSNGLYRDDVIDLKVDLASIGFHVSSNPTIYFGPQTENVVREFQSYYGLTVDGIAGQETLAKINEIKASPFQDGGNDERNIQLKKDLSRLGFHVSDNPTDYFGSSTEKQVKAFQKKYGLVENGIADSKTRAKIDELIDLIDAPLANGLYRDDVIDLKLDLEKTGFKVSDNPTDYFGPTTEQVVKNFQTYYGITEDEPGVAGEKTLAKIEEVLNSPFQDGKKDKATIQLKIDLETLGFKVSNNPTNYYGSTTEKQVKAFQKKYGLVENGIADSRTRAKIEELLYAPLENGMHRGDVIDLKVNLAKIGFHVSDNPTTYYGSTTERVVKDFQTYYGLTNVELGVAGKETLAKIDEVVNSPFQDGKNHQDTIQLKNELERLGFKVSNNPTDYYGSTTKSVVQTFQAYYGLKANGIADSRTKEKIQDLLDSPFQNGKEHEKVVQLKQDLSTLGFHVSDNPTTKYGDKTESQVRAFQEYFGLRVNGIADEKTFEKIAQVLDSPFQDGRNHEDTIQLKIDLEKLGYKVSNNPTEYYGSGTAEQVKAFQADNGLRVSGIADEVTLTKIKELLETKVFYNYRQYDFSLNKILQEQMKVAPQSDAYRNEPAFVHSSIVTFSGSGVITENGVRLRTSTSLEGDSNIQVTVNSGTSITVLDEVTGDVYQGSKKWYKIKYNDDTLYVHASLASPNGKATVNGNVRADTNTSSHIYASFNNQSVSILETINDGSSVSGSRTWYRIALNAWRNAKDSDVKPNLDPSKVDQFQHLVLSGTAGLTEADLVTVLKGKGILEGQSRAKAFYDASNKYNVNEVYLVAHAFLETGHGTSTLANGVYVDSNGNPHRDSSGNLILDPSKLPSGATKVYNMFGIAAYDSNPTNGAARYAYEKGWTTPEKAIEGGAKWISDNYVNHSTYKQNTLYKMRWNPDAIATYGYATHQYATDIEWADKQLGVIKDIYDKLPNAIMHFDIVKYK